MMDLWWASGGFTWGQQWISGMAMSLGMAMAGLTMAYEGANDGLTNNTHQSAFPPPPGRQL